MLHLVVLTRRLPVYYFRAPFRIGTPSAGLCFDRP